MYSTFTINRSPANSKNNIIHHLAVFALLVSGLLLRFFLLDSMHNTPYSSSMLPDEQLYHDWAINLLSGQKTVGSLEYAPLPAYFLALVYNIFGTEIEHFRIANIFVNILGCMVVYRIASFLVSRNWAILALLCAVSCQELVFYSVVPLKTSLSFLLFSLFILFLLYTLQVQGKHPL